MEVLMPKLGLTMTEGTIEEWKHKEGDTVKKGDVLFTVATDKLVNEVEADADGVLLKILLPEGETAPCKSVIAYLGQAGEAVDAAAPAAAPAPEAPEKPEETPAPAIVVQTPVMAEPVSNGRIAISPYARRTARELGVDIAALSGTGPNGRIVWRDVDAAYQAMQAKTAAPVAGGLAGLYTAADVAELLHALTTLDGALTLPAFVERAVRKLADFPVQVRDLGTGILGGMIALTAEDTAMVTFGAPEGGTLRLYLAYQSAQVEDAAAAGFLRNLRAALENPLSLLI